MKVLERSEIEYVGADTRKLLKNVERNCSSCQIYAQRPRRFKFTLKDDKEFTHILYADIFCIDAKPIMHVVDEATNF